MLVSFRATHVLCGEMPGLNEESSTPVADVFVGVVEFKGVLPFECEQVIEVVVFVFDVGASAHRALDFAHVSSFWITATKDRGHPSP